jgi:hypothetical protein
LGGGCNENETETKKAPNLRIEWSYLNIPQAGNVFVPIAGSFLRLQVLRQPRQLSREYRSYSQLFGWAIMRAVEKNRRSLVTAALRPQKFGATLA